MQSIIIFYNARTVALHQTTFRRMMWVLYIVVFTTLSFKSFAQHLTTAEVDHIAQSLYDKKIISETGKQELIRFAAKQPLQVYHGFSESSLNNIPHAVYFLEEYKDILPGRAPLEEAYFDAVLAKPQYSNPEKAALINEEKFLSRQFPCRSHLFDFLHNAALFCNEQKPASDNDNTGSANNTDSNDSSAIIATRFAAYFNSGMAAFFNDTTIDFSVSYDNDTKRLQQERVEKVRPFTQWISIFKDCGLLNPADMRLERKYSNGEYLYSSVNNAQMFAEISKLVNFYDKFPYYRTQQNNMLEQLVKTGFITETGRNNLIQAYQADTLISIEDIAKQSARSITFNRAREITPYDFVTKDYYGQIPLNSIKKLYESVLKKVSALLHFSYSGLKVFAAENKKNGPGEQLLVLGKERQYLMYVTIDSTLYEEVIAEKEFESWIRGENFQFLNHYMEDKHDSRRFFFGKQDMFTGYEPQQATTLCLSLLTEAEQSMFQNKYMASDLESCYNGSPGNYDYAVYETFAMDTTGRLMRSAIANFVDICKQAGILKYKTIATRDTIIAVIRETNPETISNILIELPNTFTFEKIQPIESFLTNIEHTINRLQHSSNKIFTHYHPVYKTRKKTSEYDQQPTITGYAFICGSRQQQIMLKAGDDLWANNQLLNAVNKAMAEARIPWKICPLFVSGLSTPSSFMGNFYILLSPEQADILGKKYPHLFKADEKLEDITR